VRRNRPKFLAVLGLGAFRVAFDRPKATIGEQEERIANARLWVLPNPSGVNANYQRKQLVELFRDLKRAVDRS
jgi:TDG/mug DNA glycosylase family protein